MTMPNERTRALIMAGDFLRELLPLSGASDELKRQARVILRHYPTENEIDHEIRHIPEVRHWLGRHVSQTGDASISPSPDPIIDH